MEQEQYENAKLGTERPPITPQPCTVETYKVEDVTGGDGKAIGPKLILTCKHPDAGMIELSGVMYQRADKIVTSGLWVKLDDDKGILNPSATASMLKHYNAATIGDLKGKVLQTATDDKGYLIVKAY